MIHRDLKIGLVLGLVFVVIVVIKLATDPDLSIASRMRHFYNTASVEENGVSPNDVSQDFVIGEIPLDSEQQKLLPGEHVINVVAQNEQLQNIFSPRQLEPRQPQPESVKEEEYLENKTQSLEITPDEPVVEVIEQEQVEQGQLEVVEPFNYDEAELIKTEKFHIVRQDQTLSEISRLYYGSANKWQKIVDKNSDIIKDPNRIKAGMKLIIPD